MSPLFSYNGLLLAASGALAASESCCCDDGCKCYKVDYTWSIEDCQTLSGSFLWQNGIKCYDISSTVSVSSTLIDYGSLCTEIEDPNPAFSYTSILFDNGAGECDPESGPGLLTIVLTIDGAISKLDLLQLPGNICCDDFIGTFTYSQGVDFFWEHSFSMTISVNNNGTCNCSGYTPVV